MRELGKDLAVCDVQTDIVPDRIGTLSGDCASAGTFRVDSEVTLKASVFAQLVTKQTKEPFSLEVRIGFVRAKWDSGKHGQGPFL